ncbi:MAG: hypothetical protein NT007_02000 [Candidatus Kapabacteria bacterium]|nr:hypothetical protein [Candidatus Kapabacteria bacterium]
MKTSGACQIANDDAFTQGIEDVLKQSVYSFPLTPAGDFSVVLSQPSCWQNTGTSYSGCENNNC